MIESEKLILNCAKNLKKAGAHFLRGGAFKPLTFPYRSEKYNETRERGIEWISEASTKEAIPVNNYVIEQKNILEDYNLPTSAENIDKQKISEAIKMDKKNVDGKVKWILLDALGKSKIVRGVDDKIVNEAINEVIF